MTTYLDHQDVIAPLDAFATLPGWLAAGMDPEAVRQELGRTVPEFTDGSLELLSVTPERLRAKGAEWLARYRLCVTDRASDAPRDVALTGTLLAPFMDRQPAAEETPDISFGQSGWRCWLPGLRLDLQFEAVDEALPALADIVDPRASADLLQRVLHGAGYRDAVIASCEPKVVRYKPGSRCTVVADLAYRAQPGPRPPERVVLKTHQGDKGQTAWAAMTALWNTPLARGDIVSLAEPLAFLPDERVLVQGPVAEDCTLKELARSALDAGTASARDGLKAELAKTGRALAALHTSGAVYGRTATFDEEMAEVTEVVARLSLSVPELHDAAQPLLDRLGAVAGTSPPGPSVPAHHDFRPAQVLLHQGSIGFIDFDGASMAEPALDLGRFRAKLRDIGISVVASKEGALTQAVLGESFAVMDDLCDHFLDAYREHAPVSLARVRLWETSDLVTAMLHAWTKVRLARIGPRLAVLQHYLSEVDFAVPA
jgi:Phosphotransferase enzyme family